MFLTNCCCCCCHCRVLLLINTRGIWVHQQWEFHFIIIIIIIIIIPLVAPLATYEMRINHQTEMEIFLLFFFIFKMQIHSIVKSSWYDGYYDGGMTQYSCQNFYYFFFCEWGEFRNVLSTKSSWLLLIVMVYGLRGSMGGKKPHSKLKIELPLHLLGSFQLHLCPP